MPKRIMTALLLLISLTLRAQQTLDKLTVEKIMRDPKWIGTSPSRVSWSLDGQYLYFNWNPENSVSDSIYFITLKNHTPIKASLLEKQNLLTQDSVTWNTAKTAYVYSKDGDIFFTDAKSGKTRHIIQTTERERSPLFSFNDSKVVYNSGQNLYAWDIATGETVQLTSLQAQPLSATTSQGLRQFRDGGGFDATSGRIEETVPSVAQEQWLKNDQLQNFEVLRERKEKKDAADAYNKKLQKKELRTIPIGDRTIQGLTISPDGRFISYRLIKMPTDAKTTIVASYVTETGFTTEITGRTKVGAPQSSSEYFIYDRIKDTVLRIKTDTIPGIHDLPDYVRDYPNKFGEEIKNPPLRGVVIGNIYWSPKGTHAVLDMRAQDNKDRWLMMFDTATGKLKSIDRQHDGAWIGGPGVGFFGGTNTGWVNENLFWFQSEATGYSHLYTVNVETGERKTLTSGKYEVQDAQLSKDKKYFYVTTNEVHPGEQQFYRLPVSGGKAERITTMTGANQVVVSPDEKYIAILYSYSNKPWELYLQENLPARQAGKPGGKLEQITKKAMSDEFKSYPWRDPDLITFIARDGAPAYARLYKPTTPAPGKPAVLFVHGAGYLQNAHKWWSSYFREYMFNNMLADNGYYVMDIDYRGSAGYGRDWRTGIYRHMGGKDLDDNVDGANYLVKTFGVDPKRIGIYGGSYGGFMTLMALFTTPDVFAAGAALRPVTDWANYNHGYTSSILNEPYNDSLAYKKSSPIYFASGLKSHLLICHGMVDVNVHFQDAVKLTQRLIELGKDNWQIAPYPMEDHGFVEPSSWTDEYKRIFNLFEETLKK
ncbi:MAG TPA: prolyl oligopeptidase family serine peptidase [Chitinophagaceae bacterium]|nr:prolyl oligopeptidase family serine peptidase [Chitinophagaceae bacterium]